MKFSTRTGWHRSESHYVAAVARARAADELQHTLIDLTVANPAACGLGMNSNRALAPLSRVENLIYDPQPLGMLRPREAVAAYYADRSATVAAEKILLTASTSEAYTYLLRLLCNVNDEVLIAAPGYPLLDVLAELCDVSLKYYPVFYDHGWHIDRAALETAITPRTRAIIVVHPNNPTGHYTRTGERAYLETICGQHDLALIVDEVFLDYAIDFPGESFVCGDHPALTFVLSGLSKIAALPQMKVGWMAAAGPGSGEALERLEIIADSYLSVGTPAQNALRDWLKASAVVQAVVRARVQANLAAIAEMLPPLSPITRLLVEAGWYAILRLPNLAQAEEVAVRLLKTHQVLVQPGHLFGMDEDCWLVISLLPEETVFREGFRRILEFADRLAVSPQS